MAYDQPPASDGSPGSGREPGPAAGGSAYSSVPQAYAQPPAEPTAVPTPVPTPPPYGGSGASTQVIHVFYSASSPARAARIMGRVVAGLVVVPVIGGAIAGIVSSHSSEGGGIDFPPIAVPDPNPGTLGNPLPVTAGKPFSVGGLAYRAGWRIGADKLSGHTTVLNLRATNPGSQQVSPAVTFFLSRAGVQVATITCGRAGLEKTTTAPLFCASASVVPRGYDTIAVASLF